MKQTSALHLVRASLLLGTAWFATAAMAQDTPDTPANDAEIVVTATKQEVSLARVPAAVTAIGAADLGPGGIEDIGDLQVSVPNLSIGEQFGVNRTFIRGIGMTSIDLGADGAVAFLQDGALISRPAAQLAGFYDLAQIEVLRGPQGTIYGRSATAGAINLITKKPGKELEGYARATYGNYNAMTFEGAVGGPIAGEKFGARIAGKYEKRDGYGKNLFTGSDIDDRDAYAVRGTVVAALSETVEATVTVDHFKEDDHNYAFHYFGPSVTPENSLAHNLLGGKTIFDYYAEKVQPVDLRDIYSDEEPLNNRKGTSVIGLINVDGDNWSLKSISSYRDFNRFTRDDLDVSDVPMYGRNDYIEDSQSMSQEFTVNYDGGNFRLLGGAMYFHEKLYGEVKVPTVNLAVLFNALLNLGLPNNFFDNGNYWQKGTVKTDAYGAYLQGTYDVSEQLHITLGARYNYEKRDGVGRFTFEAQGLDIPTDKQKSWDAITPKLLVEFTPTQDALVYATVTRGFKSGVINVGSINSVINPEYVWNYEGGFKTKFADGRMLLSGAVFYYDYKDLQVGFVNANSIVETINAASARNYGAELELSGRVTEALKLNAFASYLNAKFKSFCTGYYGAAAPRPGISYPACPTDAALVSLKGNRLPNAPELSFGAGFDYRIALASGSSITVGGDVSWQDKVYFTEFNNIDAEQKSYAMVNANITYRSADDRWSLGAWVKNLGDVYAVANNIVTAPLYGNVRVGSLTPPRTYGVTAGVNF